MSRFNIFCVFTFCTCFAARDPPTVTIPGQGIIQGREVSRNGSQKILGFYGIPYAVPPLETLRFAPPDADNLQTWEGVLNATEYKPACLQTKKDIPEDAKPFLQLISPKYNEMETSEDCLYLNVFVPYDTPPSSGFATIIWFHPGNFTTGSPAMWNPHTLVYRHRIIMVTFAWRLNLMGFFTTMDGEAPGNYGMMDQQAAMRWVKRNINLFGGNDDNISLMGYGTGGTSVGLHMINEDSREYFHKAIVMSANFLSPAVVKDPKEDQSFLDDLARTTSCYRRPTSQMMACLRAFDGKALVDATSNINYWRPLLDLDLSNSSLGFLPDLPKNFFERGDFYKIPVLTGYTNMEEILRYKSLIEEVTAGDATNENLQQILSEIVNSDIPMNNSDCPLNSFEYASDAVMFFYGPGPSNNVKDLDSLRRRVAEFTTEKNYAAATYLQASYNGIRGQPTFVYRFDLKPSTSWVADTLPDWVLVPHLYDLIYIWGIPHWQEFDEVDWEARDKRISEIVMSFWTNFAKTSDPTNGSSHPVRWDQFTPENPRILIMDESFNMSDGTTVNYKAFEFWNDYYPKVMQASTVSCDALQDSALEMAVSHMLLVFLTIPYLIRLI